MRRALLGLGALLAAAHVNAAVYQLGELTIDAPDYSFSDVAHVQGGNYESYKFTFLANDQSVPWPLNFALSKPATDLPDADYRVIVMTGQFHLGGGHVIGLDGQPYAFWTDDVFNGQPYLTLVNGALADNTLLTLTSASGVGDDFAVVVTFEINPHPVPEPSTITMAGAGLLLAGLMLRRRRSSSPTTGN